MKAKRGSVCVLTVCLMLLAGGCKPDGDGVLTNPLGITVVQNGSETFHELVGAGQLLPLTLSETFVTASPEQHQVEVDISQKHASGIEKIVTVIMDVPPEPPGTSQVIVTLKVDRAKQMTLKATAIATGKVKEYGPFPVE